MIVSIDSRVRLSYSFLQANNLENKDYYIQEIISSSYDYATLNVEDVYIELDWGDYVYVYGVDSKIGYGDLVED